VNDDAGIAPTNGTWRIVLHPAGVPQDPKVHNWAVASLGSSSPSFPFFSTKVDTTVNVNTPGTASSAITVAAHTTKRTWTAIDFNSYQFSGAVSAPQICPFSARGPRRDGVMKPDLSAPGSAIGSTLSGSALPPYPVALTLPDGEHVVLQGTSMSSPAVAGAVAMILQNDPGLSPTDVKQLLYANARSDATTGAVPNPRWGYGRLELDGILCDLDTEVPSVTLDNPTAPEDTLYTGTTIGINWSAGDNSGVTRVSLDYRVGGGAWTPIADDLPNTGYHPFQVPGVLTSQFEIRVRCWDCMNNEASAMTGHLHVLAPSVGVEGELPLAFAAHRPIPNPFTAHSTIRFDLPVSPTGKWPVEVSLYNVAGRRVRTLVSEALEPGRYRYEWDGRDEGGVRLAAGVYFLQVTAGPHAARDRIVFLR
ncbi:MAG: S8 family serine peptidase, partial [Candidatus Rokuibacteriota bacterium]